MGVEVQSALGCKTAFRRDGLGNTSPREGGREGEREGRMRKEGRRSRRREGGRKGGREGGRTYPSIPRPRPACQPIFASIDMPV